MKWIDDAPSAPRRDRTVLGGEHARIEQTGERIRIRVVDGSVQGNYVLGKLRYMELPILKPVQVASMSANAETVTIRLQDASPFTRVHVFATRYQPAFSAFNDLGRVRDAELSGLFPASAESVYLTGRNIGDEYRYVLDRRGQKKYPGNMLERPGLLLNPWAARSTETGEQFAQVGQDFGAKGDPRPTAAVPAPMSGEGRGSGIAVTAQFANLDFLADASAIIVNLVPDKEGAIKIERKLIEDDARPILFYTRAANCREPYVKGLITMVNSIYNSWRFEDLWLDK